MIDWEKINNSYVVKTFRPVCYKWWGVDIQFYDEYGECKSGNTPFQNQICKLMHSKTSGEKICFKNYRKHLNGFERTQRFVACNCSVGLDAIAVPLLRKGKEVVGALVGSGLKLSNINDAKMEKFISELVKLGFDKTDVEQRYNELREGSAHIKEYLLDLLESVAADVMAFYEMMEDKEEIIKKQSVLLERAYNAKYKGIIGTSPKMKKIFDTLDLIENSGSSVLIEGESGTGKELFAAAIHYNSPRRAKMFIIQNCSAFTETLLNSELFGHEKGAFTGAISDKNGLFEIADGGTLFLDEVGDMKLDAQARLLRVLEDGSFFKVGGTEPKRVDVRVIVATNKKLRTQVEEGLFRKDLFYRMNTIHITIPPLRDRGDDIILLANYFLETYAEINSAEKKGLSQKVIGKFISYQWPGNIRELKNMIERAVIVSGKDKMIELCHLPDEMTGSAGLILTSDVSLLDAVQGFESVVIEEELKKVRWNKGLVCKSLDISRVTLNTKIRLYNLKK
ncbi:MAG: sigma 54-interacting transcriptional regulator [Candidatus Anammoxibacter sp.]